MVKNNFKQKQNIIFIVSFIVIYSLLLFVNLRYFANHLILMQVNLIKNLFGGVFNYNSFVFVAECSGVVSISTYLSTILALLVTKVKGYFNFKILLFTASLLVINFLRLIVVLLSEKVSFGFAKFTHIFFWFVMGGVIIIFILKSREK